MARSKPDTVSAKPLFAWFDADKKNRKVLRDAGYTDGRITNWRTRGIPRAEVGAVAQLMNSTYERYLADAGELKVKEPDAIYGVSKEALEIAQAFQKLPPARQAAFREAIFLEAIVAQRYPWLIRGRPAGESYNEYERAMERDIVSIAGRIMMKEGNKKT
jgi:hypothetical protein